MHILGDRFLRLAFVVNVAFAPCYSDARQEARSLGSTLFVTVTSCWGNAVPDAKVRLHGLERQTEEAIVSYPAESEVKLSGGRYRVSVEATGFLPTTGVISVSDDDLDWRTCLTVAPVSGTRRPWVDFRGLVSSEVIGKCGPCWVRLIGLYSDTNVTSRVNQAAQFSFLRLQPGRYLLLLFDSGGLRSQREVDVREEMSPVQVR